MKESRRDSKTRRRQGVREMERKEEGVNESDFFGMGVIWEMFHALGVRVEERKVKKRRCMDERKREEEESVLKIRICKISRPKDLVLGYFIMWWPILVGVQKKSNGLAGRVWVWRM